MTDIEHDHPVFVVIDLVEHPPLRSDPRGVNTSQLLPQGLSDSVRILEQRAGDEFGGSGGNIPWQTPGQCSSRRRCRRQLESHRSADAGAADQIPHRIRAGEKIAVSYRLTRLGE